MRLYTNLFNECVCVCVLSSSGGVQFCSATYRLFKVGPSEQCRDKDMIMKVQYKGRWVGEEVVGGGGGGREWVHGRGGEERGREGRGEGG